MRKDTKKSVDNFESVFDTLFPDGKIPSFKDIQEKVNAGTLTYREAMIAKLYSNGSQAIDALTKPEGAAYKSVEKTNPKVLEKAESFYSVFGAAKNPQLMSGIRSDITKFSNKFKNALDTPFTEIQQAVAGGAKGLKPLQGDVSVFDKVFANVKAGKSVEGMQVGGTRIFNSIPDEQALKELLSGIKKIPDEELRQATYLALIGYRGTALQGMSASLEAATEGEDIFPYFDPETEQIVKPDVKKPGKKPLPPTSKPGPVAVDVLKFRMANASEFGELFPNITRDNIAAALNEHVYPNLSEDTVRKLGRRPSGYTDMRRFFASAVANLLGDVKQASVLIGHTAGAESLEGEIDKVLTNHYARLTKATATAQDVRHKTLFAYESILARLLGKNTSNDLAQFLGLPFEEGVTATYADDIDLLTGDATTSVRTDKQPETPEAAAARNAKNIALDEEITVKSRVATADAQIELQQKTSEAAAGAEQFVEDTRVSSAAQAEAAQIQSDAAGKAKFSSTIKDAGDSVKNMYNRFGKPVVRMLPPVVFAGGYMSGMQRSKGSSLPVRIATGFAEGMAEVTAPTGMAPSDAPFRAAQRSIAPSGSGLGPRTDVAPQMDALGYIKPEFAPYPMEDAPAPNIPDPAPPAPDMAAQGFVPVPEATANAERGEATAMTMARGGQAPSFLYGGVVR
jgi:hypothetical protein